MFKKNDAVHSAIYQDIINNTVFESGKTLGELEASIDAEYRRKVTAYGLADQGFYNTDAEVKELSDREIKEYFDRKLNR